MKNSNFIKNSIIALLPISLGLAVLFGIQNTKPQEANAYSYTTLGTMDINLNDTSNQEIRDYYAGLLSKTSSERKGTNLLKNLKPILKDGQSYFSYDHGKDSIWRLYEIVDRDWEKSGPTYGNNGTFNPSTNIISGYKFGAGKTDESKNPYVHALYMDRSIDNPVKAWGNHNQDGTGINQEHIWAKSHGFDTVPEGEVSGGARGDPMHLWAGNGYANNIHSNDFFGYVNKDSSGIIDTSKKYSTVAANYSGTSLTLGSGNVFEPQDSDKGDIARALFYMAARYNNYAGATSGINGNEPNLVLSNELDSRTGTSTYNNPFRMGVLSDLLEWNKIDPPDEFEIHRNNLLYTNFTHNRNPFIDFPSWADIAFGNSTASADPANDVINGGSEEKTLESIEVTTGPAKTTYIEGDIFDPSGMVVTAHYSDNSSAVVKSYSWSPDGELSTSDSEVTISYNGKSTTVKVTVTSGSAVIKRFVPVTSTNFTSGEYLITNSDDTFVWKDGIGSSNHSEAITLDSSGNIPYSASLENYLFTIDISKGSLKRPDGKYIGSNSDTTGLSASDTIISNTFKMTDDIFDATSSGTHLRYNSNNGSPIFKYYKSTTYQTFGDLHLFKYDEVEPVHPTSIEVTPSSAEVAIDSSRTLKATVLPKDSAITSVSWTTSDDKVATVDQKGVVTAIAAGTATITATSKDPSSSKVYGQCVITVPEPVVLDRIEVSGDYKTEFYQGDAYSNDGIVVKAYYKQGSTDLYNEDVTEDAEFSGFDSTNVGDCYVTASYNGATTKYKVTIKEVPVEENVVNFVMESFGFSNGEQVSSVEKDNYSVSFGGGGTRTAYYSDGKSVRCYAKNTFTISGPKKIVEITFTFGAGDNSNAITSNDGLADTSTGHWVNSDGADSVTFTIGGTSSHRKIAEIKVKYDPSSESVPTLESISLSGSYKSRFYQFESFDYDGLVVSAHYSDGSNVTVDSEDENLSISGYDSETPGSQTITVSYTDNNITQSATYKITVVQLYVSGLTLSGEYQTDFFASEEFNHDGMKVEATFNSGEVVDVTESEDLSFSSPDMETPGEQTVTVTFEYQGNETTKDYEINIIEVVPVSLEITENPTKISYFVGDKLDTTGIEAVCSYNDGSTSTLGAEDLTFSEETFTSAGNKTITVSYKEDEVTVADTFEVTVSSVDVVSIAIKTNPNRVIYYTGQEFDSAGLTIEATYNSGKKETITSGFTCTGFDSSSAVDSLPITVTYSNKTATFNVKIIKLAFESLTVTGYKTNYLYDTDFSSTGITAILKFNSGETLNVTDKVTYSGFDKKKIGDQTITVTYSDGKNSITTNFVVTVGNVTPVSMSLSGSYKTVFEFGEEFSYDGLIVSVKYDNNKTYQVTNYQVSGYNPKKSGDQTITVSYKENNVTVSQTYKVTVASEAVYLSSISLSGEYQTSFAYGEQFNSNGLVVTAHYSDGSTNVVAPDSISGYNSTKPGKQTITVSYTENNITKVETYTVEVEEKVAVKSISLSGQFKRVFWTGDDFNYDGLVVTAHYTDGSTKVVAPSSVTGYDKKTAGTQTITVKYVEDGVEVTTSYSITVKQNELTEITLSGNYKTEYEYGSAYSSDGLVVTAHYLSGSTKEVLPSSISGFNGVKPGKQTITVSYKEGSKEVFATYEVVVKEKVEPPTPKDDSKTAIIAGAAGGVVALGGAITALSIGLHKRKIRLGKGK